MESDFNKSILHLNKNQKSDSDYVKDNEGYLGAEYSDDKDNDYKILNVAGESFAKGFMTYHPIVNFLYFAAVICFSMCLMHPICLFTSLLSGFIYSVMLKGKKEAKKNLLMILPLMIAMAFINPAFNHKGITILTYLPSGNPLTLESIVYGIAAAAMIGGVVCWFSCYNRIMTSDKFVYLFGRIIPAMSLVLSMALRFVPKFSADIKKVSNTQKAIGRGISDREKGVIKRIKYGLNILSIMITRSLEDAVETSDSMRSRGYGLPGRTAFSIFKFERRDLVSVLSIGILAVIIIAGILKGYIGFSYFPYLKYSKADAFSIICFGAYVMLCVFPIICEIKEELTWRALKSKI